MVNHAMASIKISTSKAGVLRLWTYFRRGHSTYLAFLMSFANFLAIQYRLVIEYIPVFKELFVRLHVFVIAFFLTYIPVAIVIGWLDYKKFSVPVELEVKAKANPWVRDIALALTYIAEGKNEEAKVVLRKWVSGE